ncbi:anti-repressor SinI family protein [Bacillus sp. 1NLA3E]|nr:anti-repressor SinI family protein [Bacillus sp. 1NLA3E]AGK53329.1 hypothetical protein B1NLA3E_07835 [Bacillus sp. 1NLA3E]
MVGGVILSHEELDLEWVELIMNALDMGLSEEEIRSFLDESTQSIPH